MPPSSTSSTPRAPPPPPAPLTNEGTRRLRTTYPAAHTPEYASFDFGHAHAGAGAAPLNPQLSSTAGYTSTSVSASGLGLASGSGSVSSDLSFESPVSASTSTSSSYTAVDSDHTHIYTNAHANGHDHPYPPKSVRFSEDYADDYNNNDEEEDGDGEEHPLKPSAYPPRTRTRRYPVPARPRPNFFTRITSRLTSLTTRLRLRNTKCNPLQRTAAVVKGNAGLLLVTGAQVFLSLMNVAVKTLNSVDPPVPALELVAVRMIITYMCCMAYMLATGVPDPFLGPKGVRLLLVTRGAVGFFGLFGVYYSLQYLSLSDATVLTFLAPLCTAMAGALLLGETVTWGEGVAGLISLLGVVLIARPAAIFGDPASSYSSSDAADANQLDRDGHGVTPRQRLVAVGVALVGVLGATGAYTTIRAIGKRAHPLHSMTFFSALCVIISGVAMIVNETPVVVPTKVEWILLLLMIGVFGFLAQTLLTMGLQRETAGRGAMAVYTQIVFATILERIFFSDQRGGESREDWEKGRVMSVLGTGMICVAGVWVVVTKQREKMDAGAGSGSGAGAESAESDGRRIDEEDLELEEGRLLGAQDRDWDLERDAVGVGVGVQKDGVKKQESKERRRV